MAPASRYFCNVFSFSTEGPGGPHTRKEGGRKGQVYHNHGVRSSINAACAHIAPLLVARLLPSLSTSRTMQSASICEERSRPVRNEAPAQLPHPPGPIRAPKALEPKSILRESAAAGPEKTVASNLSSPPAGPPAGLKPSPLAGIAAADPLDLNQHVSHGSLREHVHAGDANSRNGYMSVASSPEQPVRNPAFRVAPQASGHIAPRTSRLDAEVSQQLVSVGCRVFCRKHRVVFSDMHRDALTAGGNGSIPTFQLCCPLARDASFAGPDP